jgi:hypothetical protein
MKRRNTKHRSEVTHFLCVDASNASAHCSLGFFPVVPYFVTPVSRTVYPRLWDWCMISWKSFGASGCAQSRQCLAFFLGGLNKTTICGLVSVKPRFLQGLSISSWTFQLHTSQKTPCSSYKICNRTRTWTRVLTAIGSVRALDFIVSC